MLMPASGQWNVLRAALHGCSQLVLVLFLVLFFSYSFLFIYFFKFPGLELSPSTGWRIVDQSQLQSV